MTNQLNQHILFAHVAVFAIIVVIAALRCLADSMRIHAWQKQQHKKLLESLQCSSLKPEEVQEVLNLQPHAFKTFWQKPRSRRAFRWPVAMRTLKPAH